jgi:hypothetical protein
MFTRRITSGTVLLATGLLVAGLALLSLPGSAGAVPRKARLLEPQRVSNAQLHEALRVLQATKNTLEGANHDYGGHRVHAIKAIGAAQHQLKQALASQTTHKKTGGKTAGKAGNSAKGGGKGGEPQSISNMQLADAIPILQQTQKFLEQANHDYGGHRATAIRDLDVAVQHLTKALQFEKKRAK